jgi:hypothetical protein
MSSGNAILEQVSRAKGHLELQFKMKKLRVVLKRWADSFRDNSLMSNVSRYEVPGASGGR